MTDTVTPASDKSEPDHFAEIAAELRRAADDIETLAGSGLPMPNLFQLSIQTGTRGDDELTVTAVDLWATALLGRLGELQPYPNDTYHYGTDWIKRGPLSVSIYQSVSTEWVRKREAAAVLAEREAELEKLRAEVADLRSGYGYSREVDDPTPVSPARVPLHTGGMTAGGLVDETPECLGWDMDCGRPLPCPDHPAQSELKPWESNAPLADRIAESMVPIADEAEYLPTCPECMGQHHTVEPCR